ncbi:tyrosine recombinase XerC [Promicromonospora sp. AC04]|uniref:site-specific integrase n=1 Tax=Promicromonospora sp. AC04 TaxID=2135723 RepID=UPI001304F3EE|nr:site-specific integrase [Promicromonospora sp. AC04]
MAAEAWLNAERIVIDRGEWKPPKARELEARLAQQRSITLREWARRSIEGKRLRNGTRNRYETALEKRILPELGDIPLKDLTRFDVASWYTKLAATLAEEARSRTWRGQEKSDGRGALYSAYQTLSSILNDAVDHELLDASPAKVKGALRYKAVHEPIVVTADKMWRMAELMPDYLQAIVPLAVATGLRNGELRALQRRHLDLTDPTRAKVAVRGTVANQKVAGKYNQIGPPKTDASYREVAIPSFVVPILKEHLAKFSRPGPDGMVFPAKRGGVLHASIIERNWAVVRTAVGLDELHFHDLRHTALTWAARSGATLAELMAIAGHNNPTVVLHYQHLGDEERRHNIAEKLGSVFQDEVAERRLRKGKGVAGGYAGEAGRLG